MAIWRCKRYHDFALPILGVMSGLTAGRSGSGMARASLKNYSFGVQCFSFRIWDVGFKVKGSGFGVQSL